MLDYKEARNSAYYVILSMSSSIIDLALEKYCSKRKIATICGCTPAYITEGYFSRLNTVEKLCKNLDINLMYALTGKQSFKYEPYEKYILNYKMCLDTYKTNSALLYCKELSSLISNYKKSYIKNNCFNIDLSVLFIMCSKLNLKIESFFFKDTEEEKLCR